MIALFSPNYFTIHLNTSTSRTLRYITLTKALLYGGERSCLQQQHHIKLNNYVGN